MVDHNPGWFAGRAWLDLTRNTLVEDVFFYTSSVEEEQAEIHTDIKIRHKETLGFKGKVIIRMAPWNGEEKTDFETVVEKVILSRPGVENFQINFEMKDPRSEERRVGKECRARRAT